jgi:Domain of unknown function (DUF5680)
MSNIEEFIAFLVEAKKNTYAGSGNTTTSSRLASKDLPYARDDYLYLDSYLGGFHFIGEEVVWQQRQPIWGMNYYGRMLVATEPEGFSHFLLNALSRVPVKAPFRGPRFYQEERFVYRCEWQGDLHFFTGQEQIFWDGSTIYELHFHGGVLQ